MESYYWSRSKLGPRRVYWVVWEYFESKVIADGYCETVEEAEEQAKRLARPEAEQWPAYGAANWHRRKTHEARMSRPAKSTGAEVRRYLYQGYTSDYDGSRHALAYPILRMTEKRIYVGRRPFLADLIGTDEEPILKHGPDDRAFVLDRQVLERDGHASSRSRRWWDDDYYLRLEDALNPWGGHHQGVGSGVPSAEVVEALAVLGLAWPCTERDFRAAYRSRSKQTHPDAGGKAASFIEVNAAYEVVKSGVANWPGFACAA